MFPRLTPVLATTTALVATLLAPTSAEAAQPATPSKTADTQATSDQQTLFGVNASTQGQTLAQGIATIDKLFGPVPVVRHFSSGLPFAWDSQQAAQLDGRTLVVSFKANPKRITSGSLDSFFRKWFATAPKDQTIYWSYFHEPEDNIRAGEFTAAQYRAAWRHLDRLEDKQRKPNLASTLILTEWTMDPKAKRDYRTYDAGHDVVDALAFDAYNGVWDPQRDYYERPRVLLGNIVRAMERDGRAWGIAEIGSRVVPGDDGTGRARWLTNIGRYAEANDALFVTYFNTNARSDWRLKDSHSRTAWRTLVSASGA